MNTTKTMILTAAMMLVMGACDAGQDEQPTAAAPAPLAGTWSGQSLTLVLLANGGYATIYKDGAGIEQGTWSSDGAAINLSGLVVSYALSGDTMTATFPAVVSTAGTVTLTRTQRFCTWVNNVCQY